MWNTHKDGRGPFKTQLDIDGPEVGLYDKVDQKYLEKLLVLIYPTSKNDQTAYASKRSTGEWIRNAVKANRTDRSQKRQIIRQHWND